MIIILCILVMHLNLLFKIKIHNSLCFSSLSINYKWYSWLYVSVNISKLLRYLYLCFAWNFDQNVKYLKLGKIITVSLVLD